MGGSSIEWFFGIVFGMVFGNVLFGGMVGLFSVGF